VAKNSNTILFHHGVGANTEMWAEWIPFLGMQYRIARFDMRGFGRSASCSSKELTFEKMTHDVNLIAQELDLDRFHLVGESIGGTLALFYALTYPKRLQTLTLSNTAFRGGVIQNVESWNTLLREQGPAAWSKNMMEKRFYDDAAMSSAKRNWFEQQQSNHPIDSIIDARDILVGFDLGPRLGEIELPVLLMHADASPFISVDQMSEMHSKLAHSDFHVFNHAKHGLPFSHATECANTLLNFLTRIKQ
jgi:pimeloyl-ACP methyl ester carboxylesterase